MIQQEIAPPGRRQHRRHGGALHQGARRLAPPLRLDRRHLRRHRQGRHPGRGGQEGRRRQVRRRPGEEGEASSGRLLHPLRRERRRADQRPAPAAWHPHLRPGRPRAARQAVHAHRLARPGGVCDEDPQGRPRRGAHRQGPGKERRGRCACSRATARSSSRASTWPSATRSRPARCSRAASSTRTCRSTSPTWPFVADGKPTRVGYRIEADGKKVRDLRERTGGDLA